MKIHNSFNSSITNGTLRENQKTGGSRELFLPENNFETSSAVNFPKKHPDFEGLEIN